MVQRIDFIEKGAYALTYRNMIIFVGLACVVCSLIHGLFIMNNLYVNSKVNHLKKQVQELSFQKDKMLAAMQIAQSRQTISSAPLASLFVKMPAWSVVVGDMVSKMPKQIWFEQVRSTNIGEKGDLKKLEIAGKSLSHASIAQFVNLLEDSEWFQNTVLASSKKEQNGYSFLINSEVIFPAAEW